MIGLPVNTVTRAEHCCEEMQKQVDYICDEGKSPFECADNLIYYSRKFDEYGLIIHDGGSSFLTINFLPFLWREVG